MMNTASASIPREDHSKHSRIALTYFIAHCSVVPLNTAAKNQSRNRHLATVLLRDIKADWFCSRRRNPAQPMNERHQMEPRRKGMRQQLLHLTGACEIEDWLLPMKRYPWNSFSCFVK